MNGTSLGQSPPDQNSLGQNPIDQNPLGQNPLDQNPLGQNPLGQNPLGQNPLDQNPLGQSSPNQNSLGQNPLEQSSIGKRFFKNLQKREDIQSEKIENTEYEYAICSNSIETIMSKAISKYYIQKSFTEKTRNEAKEMVENIKEAMINRIQKIEWLDDETREYTIQKVSKMKEIIGYSDDIMDPKKLYQLYENIEINNYFDFLITKSVSEFGLALKYIDRNEWTKLYPHSVGAYYDFYANTINIPAGILQNPFYSIDEQDYINYGLGGIVIGHELTHAFDNTGRFYDAEGNYNNWWTDNDDKEFNEYSQCFIDEYNAITYESNNKKVNIDGEKTLGENLADNGGMFRAYEAWQLSLLKNPERAAKRNKKLPGFENYTIDQLFYIAYGQSHCSSSQKYNPYDSHAPGIGRVNGVVVNSKHFAETFNCPTTSAMNPENKCIIW
ncbi:zincin [Anaeromyces robustus]|uniref:Zincin n=1 Tax=Anaeromyces robustus TaxID=1754192 RepID=A0A1Y1WSH9_9FUNG|nr:zincin [Anaeromyces robustus]|eukprot:ORX76355.1 zincin [Anaeromyces robustus]